LKTLFSNPSLQREADLEDQRRLAAEEEERARIIETERQRLLEEYAAKLADFLPKGTLKSEEDVQRLHQARTRLSVS
jgi:hypothetical protein